MDAYALSKQREADSLASHRPPFIARDISDEELGRSLCEERPILRLSKSIFGDFRGIDPDRYFASEEETLP